MNVAQLGLLYLNVNYTLMSISNIRWPSVIIYSRRLEIVGSRFESGCTTLFLASCEKMSIQSQHCEHGYQNLCMGTPSKMWMILNLLLYQKKLTIVIYKKMMQLTVL